MFEKWLQHKSKRLIDDFVKKELASSVEGKYISRSRTNEKKLQEVLNHSLDLEDKGVLDHCNRQTTARLQREEREFLKNNPTSHTWNFTGPTKSRTEDDSTYFMELGEQSHRKSMALC